MAAPSQPHELDPTASAVVAGRSDTLEVRLFGELELRVGAGQLGPLDAARARALLGYLALHAAAPHPRERLAFLLWPDSTEAQARTNLRKVLHMVRRTLPDLERYLEITSTTLRWRQDASLWVDVAAFNAALAAADGPTVDAADAVTSLRVAVALHRGGLLESCYDDWAVDERERLRDRHVSALRRLAGLSMAAGHPGEAIAVGRELLRNDALDEEAYRLLMGAYVAGGKRAMAVRVYHECLTTLRRELGVEPSPATVEVYEDLVRSEAPAPESDLRPSTPISPSPLVGRQREWHELQRLWRDAENGRSRLVVVTGEPGIGKTRLVEDLVAWCSQRGTAVAQARSYRSEGELGYGIVTSWLRAGGLVGHLRRARVTDLAALSRLLPELEIPAAGPGDLIDEAQERRQLFDAVSRTLTDPDEPLLLVADDAQWADAQSLQLIHYLLRSEPTGRLLVVATARREELDRGHALAAFISGLQIIERATEIPLERLTPAESERLARGLTDDDMAGAVADALYAETEGNPLFIVEAVRAGGIVAAAGPSELSPRLQAVISARLGQLSDNARDVLGIAAIVGRAFDAQLLRAVDGIVEVGLVRALDELWRRGIIREHGADDYDFSHGKLRDVAYEELGPSARRRLHLLVADAMVRTHDTGAAADAVSGQIAAHFDRAGRVEEAVVWYRRAHLEARRLHADNEAVRLLDRAAELVGGLPDGVERLRSELEVLSALPVPLAALEGWTSDRLSVVQDRASVVATSLGTYLRPEVLRSMVMSRLCRDDFDGARTAAEELHRSARRAGDDGLRIESEYLLGIAAFWGGALSAARVHFEEAVSSFPQDRRTEHLMRFGHDAQLVCLSRLANTLFFLGETEAARRTRDAAVALARQLSHPFSTGVALIFAAILAIDLEELEEVRPYVQALKEERMPARPSGIKTVALDGLVDVLDGDIQQGVAKIREAIVVCGPSNPAPGFRSALLRVLVAAQQVSGDPTSGLAAVDEALRLDGTRLWEPECRRLRAVMLHDTGATDADVEIELTRAAALSAKQGALGLRRRVIQTRARLRSLP